MKAAAGAGFAEAGENHLRDALQVTHAERWRWLQQAMELGFRSARARARKGGVTLGPHGEVMWSALHEQAYTRERRLPSEAELARLDDRHREQHVPAW